MSYENGNFGNTDNNTQQEFRPTYYSPVVMKNELSTIDPSELSFSFWKNFLAITISPKIENSNTSYATYDRKNNTKIFINHNKAKMLWCEMKKLKENPDNYKSVGVNSGKDGIISVSNGKEVGVNGFVLIIRKVDQDGNIMSSFMYEFNTTAHFAIENFDETTAKYDKVYYPDIEYDNFMNVLENYFTNVPGYNAYSVVDANRRNHEVLFRNLAALMEKEGVQTVSSKGVRSGGGSQKSFFDMAKEGSQFAAAPAAGVPARKTTIEELEGEA